MARLEDLTATREGLLARMEKADNDQNYATLARLLVDVVKQIDEIAGGAADATEVTGLSEFQKRLAEREAAATRPSRAKKR